MKKDLVTHFLFTAAFFLLITLFKKWFDMVYLPFWIGGLIGMILPDVDYLIYIYFLNPDKEISQTATTLIQKRSFLQSWDLLVRSRSEHSDLIFHSAQFQLLFMVFSLLVVTSSSLFGRGLVLAFMLHLLIDQVVDHVEKNGINNWFVKMNVTLNAKLEKWYLALQVVFLAVLGFIF